MTPFTGPGLNTNWQLMPIDKIKAIGFKWVRSDLSYKELNATRIQQFRSHYAAHFPIYWSLSQQHESQAPAKARLLYNNGIRYIGVFNEPNIPNFNLSGKPMEPQEYADRCMSIRANVPSTVKLFGPATSYWDINYIEACLKYGAPLDYIDSHFYGSTYQQMLYHFVDCQRYFGLDLMCGEFTDPAALEQVLPNLKQVTMKLPICVYRGPNTEGEWWGYFDYTGGTSWNKPSSLYDKVIAIGVDEV